MDSRRAARLRIAVYAGAWIAIVAALALTGNIPSSDEARDFVDDIGALGPLLYVPLFVLVNFAVAWPILAGAAGLLFGTAVGTPLALLGVTAAALTQMAIARKLAGEHRGRLLPQRTRAVETFLTENGTLAVMESRIVPVLPYGVVNYSAGLTHLSYTAMTVGTLIGAAPEGVRLHRPRRQSRRPHLARGTGGAGAVGTACSRGRRSSLAANRREPVAAWRTRNAPRSITASPTLNTFAPGQPAGMAKTSPRKPT